MPSGLRVAARARRPEALDQASWTGEPRPALGRTAGPAARATRPRGRARSVGPAIAADPHIALGRPPPRARPRLVVPAASAGRKAEVDARPPGPPRPAHARPDARQLPESCVMAVARRLCIGGGVGSPQRAAALGRDRGSGPALARGDPTARRARANPDDGSLSARGSNARRPDRIWAPDAGALLDDAGRRNRCRPRARQLLRAESPPAGPDGPAPTMARVVCHHLLASGFARGCPASSADDCRGAMIRARRACCPDGRTVPAVVSRPRAARAWPRWPATEGSARLARVRAPDGCPRRPDRCPGGGGARAVARVRPAVCALAAAPRTPKSRLEQCARREAPQARQAAHAPVEGGQSTCATAWKP